MIRRNLAPFAVALALALASPVGEAARFVYEGRLDDAGRAAEGRYDLKLTAYGDATLGSTLAAPVTLSGVEVRDGRFRIDVDLPLVKSDQVWLDVAVRGAGEPTFASIPGRSKAMAATLIGQCWSTTGDSGSNPATNFLGTTDAQPLVLRTRNVQSLRIEPADVLFGGGPITSNTIAGSSANGVTAGVRGATVAGGGAPSGDSDPIFILEAPNLATDHYATVGGGLANRAGDAQGTVSDAPFATVGGGFANTGAGLASVVAGGQGNIASGITSAISGGSGNRSEGLGSTVGGGSGNIASDGESTVAGGSSNRATGNRSAIGGGESNTASGARSGVGAGILNCAGGDYSWAGGRRAKVRPGRESGDAGVGCLGVAQFGAEGDQGSFVWADSQNADFVSTGVNQFIVRAAGGVYFGTGGVANLPSDRFINTSTGAHLTIGGAWTNASSRQLKTDFAAVDPLQVLEHLLRLPITTWRYRESAEGLHLGPVAEDFKAAFGLAGDGKSIATVDADGVALAAIQGLNAKLEAERDGLKAENAALREGLEALRAELAELRAAIAPAASADQGR